MNEALKPAPAATVTAGSVTFGNALPLAVMAGPCVLESRAHALETAAALKEVAERLRIGLVYKPRSTRRTGRAFRARAVSG